MINCLMNCRLINVTNYELHGIECTILVFHRTEKIRINVYVFY